MISESIVNSLPLTVIVALVGVIVLVNVVLLCVCGEKKPTSPKPLSIKQTKENGTDINNRKSLPEDQMTIVVESPPNQSCDLRDKDSTAAELSNSRDSHTSVGSNSSRPTSTLMRQLPEPPKDVLASRPLSANGSVPISVTDYPEDDPYDHLGKPRRAISEKIRQTGYEHVNLQASKELVIEEQLENEYSVPKGEAEDEMDIYAKVDGEESEEPPAALNKSYPRSQMEKRSDRDRGYAKVKERQNNSSSDDGNFVFNKDDPYSHVQGDDYSAIDINTQSVSPGSPNNRQSTGQHTASVDDEEEALDDEYATVNKVRNDPPVEREEILPEQRMTDPYMTPPEPPRGYEETFGLGDGASPPDVSTVSASASAENQSNEVTNDIQPDGSPQRLKREPSYTMVTARESLSSMAARYAFNTYEVVPDVENTYASVEGGSGDGVVQKSNQRNSFSSETYAEIEGSAGGFSPVVPAPPSLDTLHQMTKQNPDPSKRMSTSTTSEGRQSLGSPSFPRSPVEPVEKSTSPRNSTRQDHEYENASPDESHERFLLQGARPKEYSDKEHKAETDTSVMTSSVTLDPNYQTVRDSVHDLDIEFDPNYESVDEVKNKDVQAHNRKHEYEEVKDVKDVDKLREQVLRRHTYEDIVDVKEQKEELKRKSGEIRL